MLKLIKYLVLFQLTVVCINCQRLNILRQSIEKKAQTRQLNDTLTRSYQACDSNPCLNEAECINTLDGDFRCLCEWGWTGKTCEICLTDCVSNPCPANTRCKARYGGGYDCIIVTNNRCPSGQIFDNSTQKCILLKKTQEICPCLNDGECLKNSIGKITCLCKSGFTGLNCELDINECSINNNACNGGTCVDQRNTYYCLCPNNQIGKNCINTITNPCTRQLYDNENQFFPLSNSIGNTYIQCTGLSTFIVHSCPVGLFWNQQARTCANSISLAQSGACQSFPCKNAGSCVDTGNNKFKCLCSSGYTGEFCEQVVDHCVSNPCKNNGKCTSHTGGYTCLCPDKIIDDCCCNGIVNPCPSESQLIPGLNNYFPHLYPNKFIHCNFDGRAFVRTCPKGQIWKQSILSCVPDNEKIRIIPSLKPQETLQPVTRQPQTTTTTKKFTPFFEIPFNNLNIPNGFDLNSFEEQNKQELIPINEIELVEFTIPQVTTRKIPIVSSQSTTDFKPVLINQGLNYGQSQNYQDYSQQQTYNQQQQYSLSNQYGLNLIPTENQQEIDDTEILLKNPFFKTNISQTINTGDLPPLRPEFGESNVAVNTQSEITSSVNSVVSTTNSINSILIPQNTAAQNTFVDNNLVPQNFNSQFKPNQNTLNNYNNFFLPNNNVNIIPIQTTTSFNKPNNIASVTLPTPQIIDLNNQQLAENQNEQSSILNLPDYNIYDIEQNQNIIDFGHLSPNQQHIVNPKPVDISEYLTEQDFEYILEFLNQNETFNQQVIPISQHQEQATNTNSIFPYNPNGFLIPSEIKPVKQDVDSQIINNQDDIISKELTINGLSGADFREICIEAHASAEANDRDINDDDFLNAAKTVLDSKILSTLLSNDSSFS